MTPLFVGRQDPLPFGMGSLCVLIAVIFALSLISPSHSFDPDSRADLVSRFSGYNFSADLQLKEGKRFLCPSTFLTTERAILHERALNSILEEKGPPTHRLRPSLFLVVGASGSGKSFLINSLTQGKKLCPITKEDIGDFLFDAPNDHDKKRTFPVEIPEDSLSISGDDMMEKLPEYAAYKKWLGSRPKEDRNTIFIDVANSCHLEAAQLAQSVALTAVESRLNLVFEGTGQRAAFFFELATLATEHNYLVHLIHVNTDLETCGQRAAKRFVESGRGVPFDIVKRSYLLSRRTFRQIAAMAHFASVFRMGVCTQGFVTASPGKNPGKNLK